MFTTTDSNQTEIAKIIEMLNSAETRSYRLWALPCQLDHEIAKIVTHFSAMPPTNRYMLLNCFNTRRSSWALFAFVERKARLGVQENSCNHFFEALMALIIEDFREKSGRAFILLTMLWAECQLVTNNPRQLFEQAIPFASSQTAAYLRQMLS